jgi:outer membrane protein OmpA-like peptidoglycan-associated protein
MKNPINTLRIGMVFLLVSKSPLADERNFGTVTPSETEVIEHFKNAIPKTEEAFPADDDYQDVSESDLKNVRGLKKIDVFKNVVSKKPKNLDALQEKSISLQILFGYDSDILTEDSKKQLDPIGKALVSGELKGFNFKIEGHTDIIGSEDYNKDLSRRRAMSVKQYLIDTYGIAPSALEIEGKGEEGLADAANPTSEANRRVRIISLGGTN